MPEDGGEPRMVYIGTKEEWSLEETKRRVGSRNGRWTDPLTPHATKAKWGTPTFDTGRYRCCHDLEQCGVGVAVKQGPIQAWHFQRQYNYGNNSLYEYRCKNESQFRGESRFHSTATRTIARMLTPGKKLDGKTVSEKAAHEKSRRFRLKSNDVVSLTPDVFVKFDDDTWFAIEVVYTHSPERNNHDAYGTNMVVIDLKELRAVDSDQAFAKWIREEGLEKALKRESKKERRIQRYESRKLGFERQDEKEYRSAWVSELRRCRDDYEIYTLMELDRNIKIENIEDYFIKEKKRLQKLESIKKAIVRNVKRFGERLPRGPEDFSLVKDVDGYYRKELGKTLEEKKKDQKEFAKLQEVYSEEFGKYLVEKHDTIDELKAAADELLKFKKPLEDLEKKNRSDFNNKIKKLDDELEALFQSQTNDIKIIHSIQHLIDSSDFKPDEEAMSFRYRKGGDGHTVRSGYGNKFLETVDIICQNPWTHLCRLFVIDHGEYWRVIKKGRKKIEDICLRHKSIHTNFYTWLDKLRSEIEPTLRKYDGFDGIIAADFLDLVGAGNSARTMVFIQEVIDSGLDPARQLQRSRLINDDFWKSSGVAKLFSDIKLQDAWNECMKKEEEKLAKRRQEVVNSLGLNNAKPAFEEVPKSNEPVAEPTFTNSVEKAEVSTPKASREGRLAELRRKSEEFRKNFKAQLSDNVQVQPEIQQEAEALDRLRSKNRPSDGTGRRRKDEPFDPFGRDSRAQRNKRMSERSQVQRRNAPAPAPVQRPQQNTPSAHDELVKKRLQALNRLEQESKLKPQVKPEATEEPIFTTSVEKQGSDEPKVSREGRMAELRRKAEESRKNAKAQRVAQQEGKKNKKDYKSKEWYGGRIETLTKEANNSHIPEKRKREARKELDRLIKQNGKKFGDEDAE